MYTMSQINHIKDLSNCGYRISEISKKTGADPKTIRKYLSQEDFSPVPPVVQVQILQKVSLFLFPCFHLRDRRKERYRHEGVRTNDSR